MMYGVPNGRMVEGTVRHVEQTARGDLYLEVRRVSGTSGSYQAPFGMGSARATVNVGDRVKLFVTRGLVFPAIAGVEVLDAPSPQA